jgi:hypothetical protein
MILSCIPASTTRGQCPLRSRRALQEPTRERRACLAGAQAARLAPGASSGDSQTPVTSADPHNSAWIAAPVPLPVPDNLVSVIPRRKLRRPEPLSGAEAGASGIEIIGLGSARWGIRRVGFRSRQIWDCGCRRRPNLGGSNPCACRDKWRRISRRGRLCSPPSRSRQDRSPALRRFRTPAHRAARFSSCFYLDRTMRLGSFTASRKRTASR